MSLKSLLICISSLALGIAIGAWGLRPNPAPATSFDPEFIERMQHFADVDIEEYYRLKSAEEKFNKADEILGKIMQIFLADLGLHMSQSAQDASKIKFVPPPPPEKFVETPKLEPVKAPAKPKPKEVSKRRQSEDRVVNLRTDRDLRAALQEVRISDLESELKQTSAFANRNETLSAINGRFAGLSQVSISGKAREWEVSLDLAGSVVRNSFNGNIHIQLNENGKAFSNTRGSGDIRDLREFTGGDSKALLLKVSPSIYFQLYFARDLDQLVGNVYKRENEDATFAPIGTVALKRL